MTKRKGTKGQTMIYKTLRLKLKIEQHGSHKKWKLIMKKLNSDIYMYPSTCSLFYGYDSLFRYPLSQEVYHI